MHEPETVLPFIYTPTVGEACQRWHTLEPGGLRARGLYLSIRDDRGRVLDKLRAWPQQHVRYKCRPETRIILPS
jgi:malate dehydrogenase (oxaloacetate-decarboxylating)(NADP+)